VTDNIPILGRNSLWGRVYLMSMNEVIDKIAIEAAQNPCNNLIEFYGHPYGYNLLKPEEIENGLSLERILELNQEIIVRGKLPLPRLNVSEIDAILSDYPYKLPLEFYDLYQRGNGVLPIGLGDKDWNSYYNYFLFPGTDIIWKPLHESMETYNHILKGINDGCYKVEANIFPLMEFERQVWAIAGNEIQQPTSPVFRFYGDDMSHNKFRMTMAWNSLSEMIADHCTENS
jgi:hypothetical protein